MRLDKYLQEKFELKSRTYAENLIKTSAVLVDGKTVTKTSFEVDGGNAVEIRADESYASQGAYKLEEAVAKFSIELTGKTAADIGCSNGGFTDVLLRRGVKSVVAVDVADCALPVNIVEDGRVTFLKANARELPPLEKVDFVCADLSFISLKLILPSIYGILKEGGTAVTLIKPQFELDKLSLNKNGIVKNENDRIKAVEAVKKCAVKCGFTVCGLEKSPVRYENKNIEYLMYLKCK